ncbi:MAG: hypothetical protein N2V75_08940 [Methanophagales archaeon]|nr:hypothetical protein [Methanophagales archaeon]
MEKEIIFLVEESAEGGYEARALGYSGYVRGYTGVHVGDYEKWNPSKPH